MFETTMTVRRGTYSTWYAQVVIDLGVGGARIVAKCHAEGPVWRYAAYPAVCSDGDHPVTEFNSSEADAVMAPVWAAAAAAGAALAPEGRMYADFTAAVGFVPVLDKLRELVPEIEALAADPGRAPAGHWYVIDETSGRDCGYGSPDWILVTKDYGEALVYYDECADRADCPRYEGLYPNMGVRLMTDAQVTDLRARRKDAAEREAAAAWAEAEEEAREAAQEAREAAQEAAWAAEDAEEDLRRAAQEARRDAEDDAFYARGFIGDELPEEDDLLWAEDIEDDLPWAEEVVEGGATAPAQ